MLSTNVGIMLLFNYCLQSLHYGQFAVFPKDITPFEVSLFGAVLAIFRNQSPTMVSAFYPLVMDFAGINNRYGQVAVPDFIVTFIPDLNYYQGSLDLLSQLAYNVCHANGFLNLCVMMYR